MNQNPAQFGGNFQQPQQPQQKGCLGRNWKWMLPVGCLGLLLAGVALIGGIVFVAMSAIKSSEVYQGALGIAQSHPAAVERLGQPIKDGWWVSGNIKFEGVRGSANFVIPLTGSKRSGALRVVATTEGGEWKYEKLDLVMSVPTDSSGVVEGPVSLLERRPDENAPDAPVDVEEDADGSDGGAAGEASDATDAGEGEGEGAGAGDDVQTISGGVLNGKAVSKPQPPYPPAARAARSEGVVVVQVTVDETGGVTSAAALSGHPLLRAAAVAAAKQAKFSPTLLSGRPVRVKGLLTYNFVLGQ